MVHKFKIRNLVLFSSESFQQFEIEWKLEKSQGLGKGQNKRISNSVLSHQETVRWHFSLVLRKSPLVWRRFILGNLSAPPIGRSSPLLTSVGFALQGLLRGHLPFGILL